MGTGVYPVHFVQALRSLGCDVEHVAVPTAQRMPVRQWLEAHGSLFAAQGAVLSASARVWHAQVAVNVQRRKDFCQGSVEASALMKRQGHKPKRAPMRSPSGLAGACWTAPCVVS